MKRTYKVWIEIEELDAHGDPTGNDLGILPDCLGSFASLKKATAKVAEIVDEHGVGGRVRRVSSPLAFPPRSAT